MVFVRAGGGRKVVKWTWKEWAEKIKANFDTYFFMSDDPHADRPHQKNRVYVRGAYQDCVGSFPAWADFQARPNFFIALSAVSFLFG